MYQRDQHFSSNALLGAAVLFLVPAALDWLFRGFSLERYDIIIIGGCAILIVLAFLARRWSLIPSILSILLVGSWISWQFWLGIAWRPIDWILNVSCCLLVTVALISSIIARFKRPTI